MKLKRIYDLTIEGKSGEWICIYGTVRGQLIQRQYLYFTRSEAKKLFKQWLKNYLA